MQQTQFFKKIAAIALVVSMAPAAVSAQPTFKPTFPGKSPIFTPVKSFVDLRFDGLVRQTEDLSCGAAALATLLRHYFQIDVSERNVIDNILDHVDEDKRQNIDQFGFSLLELKHAGERYGLFGGGFRLSGVEGLEKLKAPVIALTTVRGYAHFVVVRGAADGKVFVGDPAFGNRTQSASEFAKQWDGVVLTLIRTDREIDGSDFMRDYALYARTDNLQSQLNMNRSQYAIPIGNEF